jgi:curved DNA-binding protein CbpA
MIEIRTAFRRAALKAHPDKDSGSTEAFLAVTFAFDILSCQGTRKRYDIAWARYLARKGTSLRNRAGAQGKHLLTRKRSAPPAAHISTKRQCGAAGKTGEVTSATQALEHLQAILQSMPFNSRQSAITSMPKTIQNVLLKFMQDGGKNTNASTMTPRRHSLFRCRKKRSVSGSQLRPYGNVNGRTYSAQIDIGFLRIYTSGHRDIEKAIERQVILSQIRDVLYVADEADHQVWNKTGKVEQMIESVIRKNASSEDELGLRACVQMRATEYVERKYVITSPVMSFRKVVALRNHLVRARRESWETFRVQWVTLMRSTRNARSKCLSKEAAEKICDQARNEFLEKQLALALRTTDKVLKLEKQKAAKISKASIQEKRRQLREFVTAQKTYDARNSWNCRMQLWLQRKLSEEELLRFSES